MTSSRRLIVLSFMGWDRTASPMPRVIADRGLLLPLAWAVPSVPCSVKVAFGGLTRAPFAASHLA